MGYLSKPLLEESQSEDLRRQAATLSTQVQQAQQPEPTFDFGSHIKSLLATWTDSSDQTTASTPGTGGPQGAGPPTSGSFDLSSHIQSLLAPWRSEPTPETETGSGTVTTSSPTLPAAASSSATGVPVSMPTGQAPSGPMQIDRSSRPAFLNSFAQAAAPALARHGLPATLAPILAAIPVNEQGWEKPAPGNNYYGIKGTNPRTGANTGPVETWEDYGGGRQNIRDTFRSYNDPSESVDDFLGFLESNPRYAQALAIAKQTGDPAQFIKAVHAAGYATDPAWSDKVLSIASEVPAQPAAPSALLPTGGTAPAAAAPVGMTQRSSLSAPWQSPPLQTGAAQASEVLSGQTAAPSGAIDQAALDDPDKWALCGPVAAAMAAAKYGANWTVAQAKRLATQNGLWDAGTGMHGLGSEVQLLNGMGISARTGPASQAALAADAAAGNTPIISTNKHYFVLQGYNPQTGQFDTGTTGSVLRGGSRWLTLDQIASLGGGIQGAAYMDNPTTPAPSAVARPTAATASPSVAALPSSASAGQPVASEQAGQAEVPPQGAPPWENQTSPTSNPTMMRGSGPTPSSESSSVPTMYRQPLGMPTSGPDTGTGTPSPGTSEPIRNPDGSVTTERSITVTDPRLNGGAPTNIPTVWGGRIVSDDEAVDNAMRSGMPWPSFNSIKQAEQAARQRSNDLGAGRSTSVGGAAVPDDVINPNPPNRAVPGQVDERVSYRQPLGPATPGADTTPTTEPTPGAFQDDYTDAGHTPAPNGAGASVSPASTLLGPAAPASPPAQQAIPNEDATSYPRPSYVPPAQPLVTAPEPAQQNPAKPSETSTPARFNPLAGNEAPAQPSELPQPQQPATKPIKPLYDMSGNVLGYVQEQAPSPSAVEQANTFSAEASGQRPEDTQRTIDAISSIPSTISNPQAQSNLQQPVQEAAAATREAIAPVFEPLDEAMRRAAEKVEDLFGMPRGSALQATQDVSNFIGPGVGMVSRSEPIWTEAMRAAEAAKPGIIQRIAEELGNVAGSVRGRLGSEAERAAPPAAERAVSGEVIPPERGLAPRPAAAAGDVIPPGSEPQSQAWSLSRQIDSLQQMRDQTPRTSPEWTDLNQRVVSARNDLGGLIEDIESRLDEAKSAVHEADQAWSEGRYRNSGLSYEEAVGEPMAELEHVQAERAQWPEMPKDTLPRGSHNLYPGELPPEVATETPPTTQPQSIVSRIMSGARAGSERATALEAERAAKGQTGTSTYGTLGAVPEEAPRLNAQTWRSRLASDLGVTHEMEPAGPAVPLEGPITDATGRPVKSQTGNLALRPGPNGEPEQVTTVRNFFGNREEVPGTRKPLDSVFRVMSPEEYAQAQRRGYFQSDQRLNLAEGEGTVASAFEPATFYGQPNSEQVIVRMRVDPADGWHLNPNDSYVKTTKPVPIDRVESVMRYGTDEHGIPNRVLPSQYPATGAATSNLERQLGQTNAEWNAWQSTTRGRTPTPEEAQQGQQIRSRIADLRKHLDDAEGTLPASTYDVKPNPELEQAQQRLDQVTEQWTAAEQRANDLMDASPAGQMTPEIRQAIEERNRLFDAHVEATDELARVQKGEPGAAPEARGEVPPRSTTTYGALGFAPNDAAAEAVARPRFVPPEVRARLGTPVEVPDDPRFHQAVEATGGKVTDRGVEVYVTRAQGEEAAGKRATRGGVFVEPVPKGGQSSFYRERDDPLAVGGTQVIPPTKTVYRKPLPLDAEAGTARGFDQAMEQLGLARDKELEDAEQALNAAWAEAKRLKQGAGNANEMAASDDRVQQALAEYNKIRDAADHPVTAAWIDSEVDQARRAGPEGSKARADALKDLVSKYGGDPSLIDDLLKIRGADASESAWAIKENIVATNARKQGYDGVFALAPGKESWQIDIGHINAITAVQDAKKAYDDFVGSQIPAKLQAAREGRQDVVNQLDATAHEAWLKYQAVRDEAMEGLKKPTIKEILDVQQGKNPTPPPRNPKIQQAEDALNQAGLEYSRARANTRINERGPNVETFRAEEQAALDRMEAAKRRYYDVAQSEPEYTGPPGYSLHPDVAARLQGNAGTAAGSIGAIPVRSPSDVMGSVNRALTHVNRALTNTVGRGAMAGVYGTAAGLTNQQLNPDDPNAFVKGFVPAAGLSAFGPGLARRGVKALGKATPEVEGALATLGQVPGGNAPKQQRQIIQNVQQLQQQRAAAGIQPPNMLERFQAYRHNVGLLGAPAGGLLNAVSGPAEIGAGLATDAVRMGVLKGRPAAVVYEAAELSKGVLEGVVNMLGTAAGILPQAIRNSPDFRPPLYERETSTLGKAIGYAIDTPGRITAQAPDALWYRGFWRQGRAREAANIMSEQGAGNILRPDQQVAEMHRLLTNPTPEEAQRIEDGAKRFADELTYKGKAGTVEKAIGGAFRPGGQATTANDTLSSQIHDLAGSFLMPFYSTLFKIHKRAATFVPGVGSLADTSQPLSEQLSRQAVGAAFGIWAADRAAQGLITGPGPEDPDEAAAERGRGIEPNSSYVPGIGFVPNQAFGSAGPALNAIGAYYDSQRYQSDKAKSGDDWKKGAEAAKYVMRSLEQFPVIQAMQALGKLATDPIEGGTDLLAQAGSSLVPSYAKTYALSQDPNVRTTERGVSPPERLEQKLLSRSGYIPGLGSRQDLPAAQDRYGRDVENPRQGFAALLPKLGQPKEDPLGNLFAENDVAPGTPPPTVHITMQGGKGQPSTGYDIPLSPAEQREWNRLRGQALQAAVPELLRDPNWQQATPEQRKQYLQLQVTRANASARGQLLQQIGDDELTKRMADITQAKAS